MAAGYHDFTAGEVLTAANLEDYCQNQSVMRFASTSARDTALSAVKTAGMYAITTDLGRLWHYDGTNWKLVSWYLTAGRPGVILADTAQSITTATVTDITWGTENSDVDGWTSGGSATLTVPSGWDGLYSISFTGKYAAAAGASQGCAILINGTTYAADVSSTLWNITTCEVVRAMTATDTIKVQVYQNSGGSVNIDSSLYVTYLGR